MKKGLLLLMSICAFAKAYTQSDQLARNYFDQGQYEKALTVYERVYKNEPENTAVILGIIASQQQLEQYEAAERFIKAAMGSNRVDAYLLPELGYNYQLQGKDSIAQFHYKKAVELVALNPSYGYTVGISFQRRSLLQEALDAFETAMRVNPKANYNIQRARIYGELGAIEKMFESYLDLIQVNPKYASTAQRSFSQFITEDSSNEANQIFRKILLKRLQSNPDVLYNKLLSWLFIQQKEYRKAFLQEKAIVNRTDGNLEGVIDLASIIADSDQPTAAKEILTYLIEEAYDTEIKIAAHQKRIQIDVQEAKTEDALAKINEEYRGLFTNYGLSPLTLDLQIDYAHFLGFDYKKPTEAISFLRSTLNQTLNRFEEGRVKMELADVLVLQEQFNQALIYYSQVQTNLKNTVLSQEARFKVAKTSYYKGDFNWAETQLAVLKSSETQLIANDALQLLLTIRDNSIEDSTQTALRKYAKADLLAYQDKQEEAITVFDELLETHKGESIEDDALLAQALLFEEKRDYAKAEKNYLTILDFFSEDILADEAHYRLAELYLGPLNRPDEAKIHYEKIIFDFADSIYYVSAQKKYRTLRGDRIEQ